MIIKLILMCTNCEKIREVNGIETSPYNVLQHVRNIETTSLQICICNDKERGVFKFKRMEHEENE